MKTVVYMDSLFLLNFIINMIILKLTDVFSKSRTSTWRICISASAGALYAVCVFIPRLSFLYNLPFKLLASVLIVYIMNTKQSFGALIKKCTVFYLVSFNFAGVMVATLYVVSEKIGHIPVMKNGIIYFNISPRILILASIVSVLIIWITSRVSSSARSVGIKKLKIILGDKDCDMSALCDTGNLLTEPISNLPVIIVDKSHLVPLFPGGIPDKSNPEINNIKLRLIPYSSIGCSSSIMTGFIPDKILFEDKKEIEAIIGISEESLCESNEYGALFNPIILK